MTSEYMREWRKRNASHLKEYERLRRGSSDRRKQKRSEYLRHAAKYVARTMQYRKDNPEAFKRFYDAWNHNRRARKAGVQSERIIVSEIAKRDRNKCGICKKRVPLKTRSLDHIIPLSKGGTHTKANVQIAHLLCNQRKGARVG